MRWLLSGRAGQVAFEARMPAPGAFSLRGPRDMACPAGMSRADDTPRFEITHKPFAGHRRAGPAMRPTKPAWRLE
jgi:hypothetical protein